MTQEYAKTLPEAITDVKDADLTNGLATDFVTVEREYSYLKVMRKCDSLNYSGDLLLFKVVPKNGAVPHYEKIESHIKEALGFYGDVSITIQEDNKAVVGI